MFCVTTTVNARSPSSPSFAVAVHRRAFFAHGARSFAVFSPTARRFAVVVG